MSIWRDFNKQGWHKTGDSARINGDRYVRIIGRIDDVIKVSGYRLGTAEMKSAHVSHEIGPVAEPEPSSFVDTLPKKRSGKIVRRVREGRALGLDEWEPSTLEE
jgi:acetyl-CoA synthetase